MRWKKLSLRFEGEFRRIQGEHIVSESGFGGMKSNYRIHYSSRFSRSLISSISDGIDSGGSLLHFPPFLTTPRHTWGEICKPPSPIRNETPESPCSRIPTPDRTEVPTQAGTRLRIISREAKGLWHRLSRP